MVTLNARISCVATQGQTRLYLEDEFGNVIRVSDYNNPGSALDAARMKGRFQLVTATLYTDSGDKLFSQQFGPTVGTKH